MKRQLAAAALIGLTGLALVGCGSPSKSTITNEQTSTTYRTTTTTSKYSKQVQRYLDTMEERYPDRPASALINLGNTACETIDVFGSVTSALIAIAEDPDWTVDEAGDAGYLFGASVPAFCPEYEAEVRALTK